MSTQRVQLTRGKYALVDLEDLPLVSDKKWQARYSKGNWYAIHSTIGRDLFMHHVILGKQRCGLEVDHINQNGLDNTRKNLRFATKSQNRANVKLRKDNLSGYKGVCLCRKTGLWRAYIQADKKWKQLGRYNTKLEAARAYNTAAQEAFGAFAWFNPIH